MIMLQDYMDIGYGYDSEDSFVDDSEAVCKYLLQSSTLYIVTIVWYRNSYSETSLSDHIIN